MPLPLTVSCFSKIQIGFTFLVPAYPGSPGKRAVKRVCVCVCKSSIDTAIDTVKALKAHRDAVGNSVFILSGRYYANTD